MPIEVPRALETMEIPEIVGTFRQAALNAIGAGFDGVEVQGANSHLIEEFLEDGTNQRTDAYRRVERKPQFDSSWISLRKLRRRLGRIE